MTYALSGANATDFSILNTGQITVGHGTMLDFETKKTYTVTVTATDPSGETATIEVTINVTDVYEAPVLSGDATVSHAENETEVATYTAMDAENASLTWSLSGDDAGDFNISSSGELTFASVPDYENPADADTDNVYMVTVEADDGTNMDTHDVTVTVTDVNEPPAITGDAEHDYAENGAGDVATFTATDPDAGAAITWEMSGADASLFDISGGVLTFVSPPDYEAPGDADGDNVYEVTVVATDSDGLTDSSDVTITVTDVDEQQPTNVVDQYDTDNSGRIDKSELADGVFDYEIGGTISKDDLADLIFSYEIG